MLHDFKRMHAYKKKKKKRKRYQYVLISSHSFNNNNKLKHKVRIKLYIQQNDFSSFTILISPKRPLRAKFKSTKWIKQFIIPTLYLFQVTQDLAMLSRLPCPHTSHLAHISRWRIGDPGALFWRSVQLKPSDRASRRQVLPGERDSQGLQLEMQNNVIQSALNST